MEAIEEAPQVVVAPQPEMSSNICVMHKIPREILRVIFTLVVSSKEKKSPKDDFLSLAQRQITIAGHNTFSYLSKASPFALSHVSKQWRSIALASPKLWATFDIIFPGSRLIELIALWLSRSRNKPLMFSLCQARKCNDRKSLAFDILTLLIGDARRWKSVVIDIDSGTEYSVSSSIADLRPSLLENIHVIYRSEGVDVDRHTTFSTFLHTSPRLKTVSWDNSTANLPFQQMKWTGIVSLTLHSTQSLPALLAALSECDRLESFYIRHQNEDFDDLDTQVPIVTMKKLKHLIVGKFFQPDILFHQLRLPSLSRLIFAEGLSKDYYGEHWDAIHHIATFCGTRALKTIVIGHVDVQCADDYADRFRMLNSRLSLKSLESIYLLFPNTSSKIQFGQHKTEDPVVVIGASHQDNQKPMAGINVSTNLKGKIRPYDMSCAVRYAFAFEAEHK